MADLTTPPSVTCSVCHVALNPDMQRDGMCSTCYRLSQETTPPSAPVPCTNCGEPVSESSTYGWLHVGGWRDCDLRVPRPVATPSSPHAQSCMARRFDDGLCTCRPCGCSHPEGQHDDGGCMFPKWDKSGGTTCYCAAYEPTSNASSGSET